MSVNLFPLFASAVFLILETAAQASSSATKSKAPALMCNTRLLNALRLTGHEPGEVPQNNTICGLSAKENCCSQIDEIKILRSWNSFTKPKLGKFAEDMDQIYNDFTAIEPYLRRLNTSQIEYHFDNVSWRRTNESQCFSGKFFLEQANYDLLKQGQNVTVRLVARIAKWVAGNFTNTTGKGVIRANETERVVREIFQNNTQFTDDLMMSLESMAMTDVATTLAKNLTIWLSKQLEPLVKLPPVPENQNPEQFYTKEFKLFEICNATIGNASKEFFLPAMQTRISEIHVATLINYLTGTLKNNLANNFRLKIRMINTTAIVDEIADEMFADEALKRYFSWFFIPTSRSRYIRVYKYLENRFYKIFSDAISRSGSLSQHAHYSVLKEVMSAIADSSLRSVLWTAYGRIAGTFVTHLAMHNYTRAVYDNSNKVSNGTMYLALIRDVYNTTWSLDPNRALNPDWWVENEVRANLANIVNRVDSANKGKFRFLKYQPSFNTRMALDQFRQINLRRARYAEFAGDNKRVCATVYRHNLVREAIFNEDKFAYCLRVGEGFQNKSLAATLGPLAEIKKHIEKLLEIKAAFYCSACSSKDSVMIDVGANSLMLSSKFCFDFVGKFRTYLNWRYTVFQNFQYKLFQYLSCFGRNANLTDKYPYESFDNLLPNNFTEWEACNQVTSITNISACFPVCNKFSLTTFSAMIEGDRVNLKRLYNYAVTVLRQYGVMFGKFEPERNYTNKPANLSSASGAGAPGAPGAAGAAPSGGAPRILQEQRRAVVYNLQPDPRRFERVLKESGAKASGAKGGNSTNSTNKTANGTNGTSFEVSKELLKSDKIKLLDKLMRTLEKTKEYTRAEHYNHDEMMDGRVNYAVSEAISDFTNMTTTVSGAGIDPFRHLPKIKFDEFMMKAFTETQGGVKLEPLERQVIKDCVRVEKQDITMFNADYGLEFEAQFKPLDKVTELLEANDKLFERYRHNPKSKTKWTDRTPGTPNGRRKLAGKQTKKTRGSFVSNLLFKVLF